MILIKLVNELFRGGFATVREGIMRSTGETVAIKIFNKWELKDDALIFIQVNILF